MNRRALLVAGFCLLLVGVAGVPGVVAEANAASLGETSPQAGGVAAATGVLADAHVESCAASPLPDYEDPDGKTSDVVGWVEGYWYDEPLDIGAQVDADELDVLTKRTAARVEALRCQSFEELPDIQMVTPDEYRADIESEVESEYGDAHRAFENARLATQLLVGQDQDAVEAIVENQASFPIAFYDVRADYIGFLTETPDAIDVNEATLAHELVHALQDQHFDVESVFEERTNDGYISSLAVVEGEARLVERQYRDNCGVSRIPGQSGGPRDWSEACLLTPPGQVDPPNWGLTLNSLAAYNAPLVAQRYESGGWDAVDSLHSSMPQSMVEALDPDRYGEFEREGISVPDRSGEEWTRLTLSGNGTETLSADILGQHGLTAMLMAPYFEANFPNIWQPGDPDTEIIPLGEFANPTTGRLSGYANSVTENWQDDRFYAYENSAGETAGVWELAFREDATAFANAYVQLLEVRGGNQTANATNVYTFDGVDGFDMAVGIQRLDERVRIVMAPSVDDLTAVHAAFEPTSGSDESTPIEDEYGSGFGVAVGLVGLLTISLLVRARRR